MSPRPKRPLSALSAHELERIVAAFNAGATCSLLSAQHDVRRIELMTYVHRLRQAGVDVRPVKRAQGPSLPRREGRLILFSHVAQARLKRARRLAAKMRADFAGPGQRLVGGQAISLPRLQCLEALS